MCRPYILEYLFEPGPYMINKIIGSPSTTSGEVRTFLGFIGYYRCYIKNFSKITDSSTTELSRLLTPY